MNIMSNFSIAQYQAVGHHSAIAYADPHQLIQMLYDALIDSIMQAAQWIGAVKSFEKKGLFISRAIIIVELLSASLNHDLGGEIADNLKDLYDYMNRKLFEASLTNNLDILLEVKGLVEEISHGWSGIRQEALILLNQHECH